MKSLLLSICFLAGFVAADYTGSWEYSVDTPDATYDGAIILANADGVYTGKLKSDDGFTTELKSLKVEGEKISFYFYLDGYKINVKGTFKDNKLNATVDAEGMQFPLIAERK